MSNLDTTLHDLMFQTIETDRKTIKRLAEENERMRNENVGYDWQVAELRELVLFANKTVEGLCEMVENSPGCFMCPLNQDEDRACGAAELYDRMRELGIEVVDE